MRRFSIVSKRKSQDKFASSAIFLKRRFLLFLAAENNERNWKEIK